MNPTEPSAHVARWIETYGAPHELVEVKLHEIDAPASRHNQARLNAVTAEVANAYADAMKAGAIFPPLVGYIGGKGIVLIDGNNRLAAATKCGADAIHVYVVDTDDTTIMNMIASANPVLNGFGATDDDKVRHGVAMVARGVPIKDAARQLSMAKSTLTRHVKVDEVRAHARPLGLERLVDRISLGYAEHLHAVADGLDSTTMRLALSAADASPNLEEYGRLVRSLKGMDSDTAADAIVEFADRHRKAINATKPSRNQSPWGMFKLNASAVMKLTPDAVVGSLPPDRRAEIHRIADDLRGMASAIEVALRP